MRPVDAPTLKRWINDGGELAILDAREDGEFGKSHLFWANPCGQSRAELRARALLPRKGVRIVCVDGGEGGLAVRLAGYLEGIGYAEVAVLEGGTRAWAAAGYVLFSGVNVPSKAFGEWVEHHYGTPSVDPGELHAMIEGGTDMVILDSRPMEEFHRMSIPGAIDVPGGELVYRIGEIAPDPNTTIVVNCAGRTRSIMGAESLRSAGVPNKVVALRNGTMGWELAGFSCDRGRDASFPRGTPASLGTALSRATAFAERSGVKTIDRAGLAALLADGSRTTHVLDVRDPAEYAAGHLPGSRNAPGGQLVQGTDNWVAVRGARIVLVDDTGVRARMTGGWLRQLGQWEVFVLEAGLDGPLETAPWMPECPEAAAIDAPRIAPTALAGLLEKGAARVVQLSRSIDFREAHLPGALWGVRTRLAGLAPALAGAAQVVVAAPDDAIARLAVPELQGLTKAPVAVLEGGIAAWKAAGLPLSANRRTPEDAECIDAYLRPYDRNDGVEAAMREYLSWEIDLVHEVARDGDARFGQA
ncbi:thiosulfate sulfurtransferase [Siccirubricoccus deserti]|uniref:Thiosulfate sulfurtransferase n=1 Tax=Siccirubricoccus deserti TaxID=2013562 RepID=A0A9X0UC80_9PROT|nr:rhodanese-like domain-containing protein [Siccirubricoccus deserti]MBC4014937.1 thiosulfate sulfurtransferase [Siccirubricoccus deserti]GGC36933.1 thiosulfate sulfurtransferase [Siccirubricoccus deserti]